MTELVCASIFARVVIHIAVHVDVRLRSRNIEVLFYLSIQYTLRDPSSAFVLPRYSQRFPRHLRSLPRTATPKAGVSVSSSWARPWQSKAEWFRRLVRCWAVSSRSQAVRAANLLSRRLPPAGEKSRCHVIVHRASHDAMASPNREAGQRFSGALFGIRIPSRVVEAADNRASPQSPSASPTASAQFWVDGGRVFPGGIGQDAESHNTHWGLYG